MIKCFQKLLLHVLKTERLINKYLMGFKVFIRSEESFQSIPYYLNVHIRNINWENVVDFRGFETIFLNQSQKKMRSMYIIISIDRKIIIDSKYEKVFIPPIKGELTKIRVKRKFYLLLTQWFPGKPYCQFSTYSYLKMWCPQMENDTDDELYYYRTIWETWYAKLFHKIAILCCMIMSLWLVALDCNWFHSSTNLWNMMNQIIWFDVQSNTEKWCMLMGRRWMKERSRCRRLLCDVHLGARALSFICFVLKCINFRASWYIKGSTGTYCFWKMVLMWN